MNHFIDFWKFYPLTLKVSVSRRFRRGRYKYEYYLIGVEGKSMKTERSYFSQKDKLPWNSQKSLSTCVFHHLLPHASWKSANLRITHKHSASWKVQSTKKSSKFAANPNFSYLVGVHCSLGLPDVVLIGDKGVFYQSPENEGLTRWNSPMLIGLESDERM